MNHKNRLFVDMDGTLAEFNQISSMDVLFEKGYFLNLKPIQNVVDAVKHFITTHPDVEVKILSAVLDSKYAESEKNVWLDRYLPEIKKVDRIFTRYGEDKTSYIEGGVKSNDFLLDDYTKNLNTWKTFSGQGIKLLNGINNTNNTWEGNRIRFNKLPEAISDNLSKVIKGKVLFIDNAIKFEKTKNKEGYFMNENRLKELTEQTKVIIHRTESMYLTEGQVVNISEANNLFTKLHKKQMELRKANEGVDFQFPKDSNTQYIPYLKTKFQVIFPDGFKGSGTFDLGFSKYNDLYDFIKYSMDIDAKDYINKLSLKPSDEITYHSKPIVTSQYMLNFPSIKYIDENTAKIIERLNEGRGVPLTVKEIRQRHKDLGKRLEQDGYSKEDLQEFKDLQDVVDELKNAQLKDKQKQAHQITDKQPMTKPLSVEIGE